MKLGRQLEVEVPVLPKATTNLPTLPVCPITKLKHLPDLEVADADYGTPAWVDNILGGKVLNKVVLHGR